MQTLSILHVEDDQNDAFLFQRAWNRAEASHPVHVVPNPRQAMEYLEGPGHFSDRAAYPLPCVILLDLHPHTTENLQFIRWLRAHDRFKLLVVVILSGSSHQPEIDAAYLAGANSFLLKPTASEDFTALVQLLKTYWVGSNQPPGECLRAAES